MVSSAEDHAEFQSELFATWDGVSSWAVASVFFFPFFLFFFFLAFRFAGNVGQGGEERVTASVYQAK